MIEGLPTVLKRIARYSSSEDERRAALELLVATMFVDCNIKLSESEFVTELVDNDAWSDRSFNLGEAIGRATAKVRGDLARADGITRIVADANARIGNTILRAELPDLCRRLAVVDGDFHEREFEFVSRLTEAFIR